jgi:hypothetical protein
LKLKAAPRAPARAAAGAVQERGSSRNAKAVFPQAGFSRHAALRHAKCPENLELKILKPLQ